MLAIRARSATDLHPVRRWWYLHNRATTYTITPRMITMTPPLQRFKLGRVSTGSQWSTVFWAQWEEAKRGRGSALDRTGTITPRVTNREAAALISAWRAAAAMSDDPFRLWHQFAAIAYGWTTGHDRLNASAAQGSKLYPLDLTTELWLALQRIALDLDDKRRESPRIELDSDTFTNPIFLAEVTKGMREDGAQAAAKVPLPACRDRKTGKPRAPRPCLGKRHAAPDGTCYFVDPITRAKVRCDCEGECSAIVLDVDWLLMRPLLLLALVVGAWWAYGNKTPPRGSRKGK